MLIYKIVKKVEDGAMSFVLTRLAASIMDDYFTTKIDFILERPAYGS